MPPPAGESSTEQTKLPKIAKSLQRDGEAEVKAEAKEGKQPSKVQEQQPNKSQSEDGSTAERAQTDPTLDAADSQPQAIAVGAPATPPERPLESLLDKVPDPEEHREEQEQTSKANASSKESEPKVSDDEHSPPVKAPHINTPRYVHHFDTYGLVQRLLKDGWTDAQAITIMKGVRVMLANNMDMAREALVSKSQVENETYLFRAACSELKTEITASRKSEQEKMRTERNQLQHEVEILSQRLGQESAAMKDEVKGMFDDRKMAVRNEQRSMESKVQQLNYQITVELQADAKSDVESLRWVMTRRVIIALATVILMVVGSLKLYSNALHDQEMDAKRKANMRSGGTQTDSFDDRNGHNGGEGTTRDQMLRPGEMVVKDGDNPSFVSLG